MNQGHADVEAKKNIMNGHAAAPRGATGGISDQARKSGDLKQERERLQAFCTIYNVIDSAGENELW